MTLTTTAIHRTLAGIALILVLVPPVHAQQTDDEAIWQTLEESNWVQDGADDAETIIYTFTDPNCPYCDQFREQAAPGSKRAGSSSATSWWASSKGAVLRKLPPSWGVRDPEGRLADNRKAYEDGGIQPVAAIVKKAEGQVRDNNLLMRDLGARATLTTIYWDDQGALAAKQGAPGPGNA